MMHIPEEYRVSPDSDTYFGTTKEDGNNGLFLIPYGSNLVQCIASDGLGWEHVSITIRVKGRKKYTTPNWDEMCWIKELFWDDEDVVVQYHPKKSQYVNNHPYVLHLWRPTEKELPCPESILVGLK